MSTESLEILAWVSPRFVGSLSGLLTNLVLVSPETVLHKVKDEDMLGIFARWEMDVMYYSVYESIKNYH